jgi:hypothetical protein
MTNQPRTRAHLALIAVLVGLASLVSGSRGRADFLVNDTGNTSTGTSTTIDGTYNFAVLDKTTTNKNVSGYYTDSTHTTVGNTWGAVSSYQKDSHGNFQVSAYAQNFNQLFTPGTGSSALNTSNRYLYLVEVTNNGTNTNGISTVTIANVAGQIGSYGIFAGQKTTGTGDDKGTVTLMNDLGPDNHPFDGHAYTPTTRPHIQSDTMTPGNAPTGATVKIMGNDLVVTFTGDLANKKESVLIGFTSDYAPSIKDGAFTFSGSGHTASGQAPLPAPEPTAYVLMGIGVCCACLIVWLRRKHTATSRVVA